MLGAWLRLQVRPDPDVARPLGVNAFPCASSSSPSASLKTTIPDEAAEPRAWPAAYLTVSPAGTAPLRSLQAPTHGFATEIQLTSNRPKSMYPRPPDDESRFTGSDHLNISERLTLGGDRRRRGRRHLLLPQFLP